MNCFRDVSVAVWAASGANLTVRKLTSSQTGKAAAEVVKRVTLGGLHVQIAMRRLYYIISC